VARAEVTVTEDLFAPSLQDVPRLGPPAEGERPWRLGSQFYVAFFGGALAVTAIASLNARRLGAPKETQRWILVLGAVGVVASVIVSWALFGRDLGRSLRIAHRVVAVLLAGALYKVQQRPDRVYAFRAQGDDDEQYDSLWVPGLVAALVGGLVQVGILGLGILALDAVFG